MTTDAKIEFIVSLAEESKAERIEVLDVHEKTVIADYFVICSGNSDVHVRSISDRIEERCRERKISVRHVEGRESGWVLLDFGDIICHIMREEQRQYYDLESLWSSLQKSDSVGG